MFAVHRALDRALADAPAQIRSVPAGDVERASTLAAYYRDVLSLLQVHHAGEDELLYPLLAERVPEHRELFARMDEQHATVFSGIAPAERAADRFAASASLADASVLDEALGALRPALSVHLSEEEEQILPIAGRFVSPPEWGALPGHALSHYQGDRIWLLLGLVFEAMPEDILAATISHMPPPVAAMWMGAGADAFAAEMALVRSRSTGTGHPV